MQLQQRLKVFTHQQHLVRHVRGLAPRHGHETTLGVHGRCRSREVQEHRGDQFLSHRRRVELLRSSAPGAASRSFSRRCFERVAARAQQVRGTLVVLRRVEDPSPINPANASYIRQPPGDGTGLPLGCRGGDEIEGRRPARSSSASIPLATVVRRELTRASRKLWANCFPSRGRSGTTSTLKLRVRMPGTAYTSQMSRRSVRASASASRHWAKEIGA